MGTPNDGSGQSPGLADITWGRWTHNGTISCSCFGFFVIPAAFSASDNWDWVDWVSVSPPSSSSVGFFVLYLSSIRHIFSKFPFYLHTIPSCLQAFLSGISVLLIFPFFFASALSSSATPSCFILVLWDYLCMFFFIRCCFYLSQKVLASLVFKNFYWSLFSSLWCKKHNRSPTSVELHWVIEKQVTHRFLLIFGRTFRVHVTKISTQKSKRIEDQIGLQNTFTAPALLEKKTLPTPEKAPEDLRSPQCEKRDNFRDSSKSVNSTVF